MRNLFSYLRGIPGRYDRGIWTITVIDLITAAGFSISVPFLSLYLYQERGISMTLVGTALLISGLISAVTQMLGGMLSDRLASLPHQGSMVFNILGNTGWLAQYTSNPRSG
jgi:predicted MFS family arabinose efflux permease